jgi:hypothetical protein
MSEASIEAVAIDLKPIEDATDFSDSEKVAVEHINFEFEQTSKLHGISRQFSIFNGSQCYQSVQQKHGRKRKFRLDLAFLDPRPFRVRNIAWKWLHASLALWALDALLLFTGLLDSTSMVFLGMTIGLAVAATMTLLWFFYRSSDIVYFRSQYGKTRLMELDYNKPDKDSFREFIRNFTGQIKHSKTASNLDQSQFLANELKELRRLKDESIVAETSYEKAKRLIFRHEAFKAAE